MSKLTPNNHFGGIYENNTTREQFFFNRNWTDRALNYICRNFTRIQKGNEYNESKPAIHIGFLDYDLFPNHPEFYATYQMQNIKSHYIFSSKISIGVVNLNQTKLATDEDKQYGLDTWVALFKSKTWEELKMIANETPELLEASKSLYKYNNEDSIRFQCYAREDYRREMNTIRRNDTVQKAKIAELSDEVEKLSDENEKLLARIKELEAQISNV